MHFTKVSAALGLMAGLATAAPEPVHVKRANSYQNVVYWGQNGGGTIENNDLSTYCTNTAGIDIIVLAFLYQYGNGNDVPSGGVGQSCYIQAGQGQNCDSVSSAITTCQANGIKVILSLGGAVGSTSVASQAEAESIATSLWNSYGNSGTAASARPFGSAFVNGFDFDIESNPNGMNKNYIFMIEKLRTLFESDKTNTYYITGAPQCPIPEPNMGDMINGAQFDYLWPQFYNNNNYTYPCALPINGNAPFNYDEWISSTADGPSANAQIFLGVPAAPLAANGGPAGETYYATPDQLSSIVSGIESEPRFGGIMLWSAGFSDSNVADGCNFAQQAKAILVNGSPCSGGPVTVTRTPIGTATATPTQPPSGGSTPTPTGTGTVQQWGQCGGEGYTGPTQCVSPYTCVASGPYWSACQ